VGRAWAALSLELACPAGDRVRWQGGGRAEITGSREGAKPRRTDERMIILATPYRVPPQPMTHGRSPSRPGSPGSGGPGARGCRRHRSRAREPRAGGGATVGPAPAPLSKVAGDAIGLMEPLGLIGAISPEAVGEARNCPAKWHWIKSRRISSPGRILLAHDGNNLESGCSDSAAR